MLKPYCKVNKQYPKLHINSIFKIGAVGKTSTSSSNPCHVKKILLTYEVTKRWLELEFVKNHLEGDQASM